MIVTTSMYTALLNKEIVTFAIERIVLEVKREISLPEKTITEITCGNITGKT